METEQTITLSGANRQSQGTAIVRHFTASNRMSAAVTKGALGLVVTGVMVAIPILHFLLVPVGLIATGVLVTSALNAKERIMGGSASCPFCDHEFQLVSRAAKFPYLERCPECSRESTITIIET